MHKTEDSMAKHAPSQLKTRGKRLWKELLFEYEEADLAPTVAEYELMERFCVLADVCDILEHAIATQPLTVDTKANGPILNRAIEAHRQTLGQMARIAKQLELPEDREDQADKPNASQRAVHAASVRWFKNA